MAFSSPSLHGVSLDMVVNPCFISCDVFEKFMTISSTSVMKQPIHCVLWPSISAVGTQSVHIFFKAEFMDDDHPSVRSVLSHVQIHEFTKGLLDHV